MICLTIWFISYLGKEHDRYRVLLLIWRRETLAIQLNKWNYSLFQNRWVLKRMMLKWSKVRQCQIQQVQQRSLQWLFLPREISKPWTIKTLVHCFNRGNTKKMESMRKHLGENETISQLIKQWNGKNNPTSVEYCIMPLRRMQSERESSDET